MQKVKNGLEEYEKKSKIKGKKKKRKGKKFIIFIIFISLIIALLKSSIFTLTEIEVKNNKKIAKSYIIAASELKLNKNLFQKELFFAKKNILKNAYIKDARVFPISMSKIEIIVEELQEKYVLKNSDKYFYLDINGKVLEEIDSYTTSELIMISDISKSDVKVKVGETIEGVSEINKLLENLKNEAFFNEISEIKITNKNGIVFKIKNQNKTVIFGELENINTKKLYLNRILEKEKSHAGEINLNVDFKEKFPIFKEEV